MKLETRSYTQGSGWSRPLPTDLDSDRTLVLAFGASSYGDGDAAAPLRELWAAFPHGHVLGCSTAGEIDQDRVADDSIVVAITQFDSVTLRRAHAAIGPDTQSFDAGVEIGQQLMAPDLRAVFVLSDGLNVNGSALVRGLNSALPESVTITGGLAGDGARFERTWVLEGGEPRAGHVIAIGLCGDRLLTTHGSKGGWDIFGPERRVTRSRGNVLYELDGKPALKLYKDYLGDRASELPASALLFPLAIRSGPTDEKRLVRTILAVDEVEQSMTFAGDVPTGALAQLMRANFDRLVAGASSAATSASLVESGCVLSVAISCVGRRLVLGLRTEEEVEATLEILPTQTQQVGFYSYGEISPFATDGACDLHNQTMTLTTFAER